jgi:hypothetical protein
MLLNKINSHKMDIKKLLIVAYVCTVSCACSSKKAPLVTPTPPVVSSLLYSWDFEGNDPLKNLILEDDSPLKNAFTVVADPMNAANKVMKTVLLKGLDRAEVSLSASDLKTILYFYADAAKGFRDKGNAMADATSLGNEVWVSIKILKPQEQNTNGIKPCIFQFGPVSNPSFNPPVSSLGFCQLRMRNGTTPTGDDWNWRVFGANVYTPATLVVDNNFTKPNYGKWEKFVFHCKYSTATDGVIEVWKDGVKHINLSGINAVAFNRFRIKWGIYLGIGSAAGSDLTCYFDNMKIAGSNSSYDAISRD